MSLTSPAPTAPALPPGLTDRLRQIRDALLTGLVERDVPIRLALLAALAGEHLLLVGPPGTAKSLVARRLHLAFTDATWFERLLTRFTVPEELFGPLSIKGLEEDRYERLTDAYLPTAAIAFLDEIFKANSAILNALLTLLNEREFDNGARRESAPLIALIGASNELPEGEELHALFDRFLLRLHVGPVTKAAFPALLGLRGEAHPPALGDLRLTPADLAAVQAAAPAVAVPDDVVVLLCDLRDWCTAEGVQVSDRRWRKVVKLLQVSALSNGRHQVSIWDCWLLQHCLWDAPETREKLYAWYAARVGASAAMDPSRLTRIVVAWEGRLKQDEESRSQARDEEGRLLYQEVNGALSPDPIGNVQAMRGLEPLFLAPVGANDGPHWYRELTDRTNSGKGYTTEELKRLGLSDGNGRSKAVAHWEHLDSYLANPANWHTMQGSMPPAIEPTRHKRVYIDATLGELRGMRRQVEAYQRQLLAHLESLQAQVAVHLWVTPDFAEPATRSLEATRAEVETLLRRLDKLEQGFELLPVERPMPSTDAAPADPPAPTGPASSGRPQ
jgi:MoxR-like ATPase